MAKLVIQEVVTGPSTPAAGTLAFYAKTDDALYIKNSAGVEVAIGVSNAIDELTGDVTAIGPGTVAATVAFVGGVTAANVASGANLANAATDANTFSAIVRRDGSGNFTASTITASLTGAASLNVLKSGDTMSGNLTVPAVLLSGTGGLGFEEFINQSSPPSTPTSAFRMYADSSSRLSWIGPNGFTRTFDGLANTANRTYTLPNTSDFIATAQMIQAFKTAVVTLTDAATITTDASLGNTFDVTLTANRILGAPTNPINGQKIVYRIKQDGTGNRGLTLNAIFNFNPLIPSYTPSTGANKIDLLGCIYDSSVTKWQIAGLIKGL